MVELSLFPRLHGCGRVSGAHATEGFGLVGLVRVAPLESLDHLGELLALLGKRRLRGYLVEQLLAVLLRVVASAIACAVNERHGVRRRTAHTIECVMARLICTYRCYWRSLPLHAGNKKIPKWEQETVSVLHNDKIASKMHGNSDAGHLRRRSGSFFSVRRRARVND